LNHNFSPKLHRKDSVEGIEKGKQIFFPQISIDSIHHLLTYLLSIVKIKLKNDTKGDNDISLIQ